MSYPPDPGSEKHGDSGPNKSETWDEGVGSTFGIRVPASVLAAYHRLPKRRKRFVREVLRNTLVQLVRTATSMQASMATAVENYNININVPVALVKAEDTGDLGLMRERIKELEFELRQTKKVLEGCREKLESAVRAKQAAEAKAAEAEKQVKDLEARLKSWGSSKERIVAALRAWARGEIGAEEALHRIAQEFYVPELMARRPPSP